MRNSWHLWSMVLTSEQIKDQAFIDAALLKLALDLGKTHAEDIDMPYQWTDGANGSKVLIAVLTNEAAARPPP